MATAPVNVVSADGETLEVPAAHARLLSPGQAVEYSIATLAAALALVEGGLPGKASADAVAAARVLFGYEPSTRACFHVFMGCYN